MDSSIQRSSEMRIHESDFRDNLSLQGIMQRCQEASEDYTESINCTCAGMIEKHGISWMLALVHLEMKEYPHTGDMIQTKLWPVERDSILMPWYYELSDGNGNVYGIASQSWMIVNVNKRKILRPNDLPGTIIPDTENGRPCRLPSKALELPEDMKKLCDHRVLYSDCDMNGHMNNTRYTSMIMDIFPKNIHESRILREFDCFFKKETSLEHNLEIFTSDINEKEVFIYCTDEGTETFRCRILWS